MSIDEFVRIVEDVDEGLKHSAYASRDYIVANHLNVPTCETRSKKPKKVAPKKILNKSLNKRLN